MPLPSTFAELFKHNDWARDKLLALSVELNREQLDQRFAMGPGSLLGTLRHLYGAERIWFDRWEGTTESRFPRSRTLGSVAELAEAWRELSGARNAILRSADDDALRRSVSYVDLAGEPRAHPLGELMLHVCNHGVHHRAQALNMLRHLCGKKTPGLDFLFMRLERPTAEPGAEVVKVWRGRGFDVADTPEEPAELDIETVRAYYRYSDWANARLQALASDLGDEQLDKPFEMGVGALRKTLTHIRDAEEWWCNYWNDVPQSEVPELPPTTSIRELMDLTREIVERRERFLDRCSADELLRPVTVQPTPGTELTFRLGESVLQLPTHGTHHRAQAVNMLRQLNVAAPELDYVLWLRESGRD